MRKGLGGGPFGGCWIIDRGSSEFAFPFVLWGIGSPDKPSFQHVHEPSNADWAAIQQQFVDAYFELGAVRKCTFCDTIIADNSEHIKCGDCGTQTYFCSQKCFRKVHNAHCNPFHKAQEWLVSNFQLIYTSYIFFRRSTFKESTKC